ncbi:hypothetical protein V6Z12_A11G353000 [Gossypium hirsutum]
MSSSKSTYSRKLVFILYRKFLIIFGINVACGRSRT